MDKDNAPPSEKFLSGFGPAVGGSMFRRSNHDLKRDSKLTLIKAPRTDVTPEERKNATNQ
jgi:hypothetical protein